MRMCASARQREGVWGVFDKYFTRDNPRFADFLCPGRGSASGSGSGNIKVHILLPVVAVPGRGWHVALAVLRKLRNAATPGWVFGESHWRFRKFVAVTLAGARGGSSRGCRGGAQDWRKLLPQMKCIFLTQGLSEPIKCAGHAGGRV